MTGVAASRAPPNSALERRLTLPIWCADWRCWALVDACIGVGHADAQQPAAVGDVTDADTELSLDCEEFIPSGPGNPNRDFLGYTL